MRYNVNYFIKKFEAIPENKWCIERRNGKNGSHCAHGWCALDGSYNSPEEQALTNLAKKLGLSGMAPINNAPFEEYQQSTPKQRILAALYDIKKMQQPKEKVKIVYVTVSPTLKEQSKELLTAQS